MIESQPIVLSLTDAAAVKLQELTKDEASPEIGLRVYVYSGGCSGYRYGMMLEDAPTSEDQVLQANGVRVYVDGNSMPLLMGSQIDALKLVSSLTLFRAAAERLRVGEHRDRIVALRHRRERELTRRDQTVASHHGTEEPRVERLSVEREMTAEHDAIAGAGQCAGLRRARARAELEGPIESP